MTQSVKHVAAAIALAFLLIATACPVSAAAAPTRCIVVDIYLRGANAGERAAADAVATFDGTGDAAEV
jgi:hypothetical protein